MFNTNCNLILESDHADKGKLYVGGYASIQQVEKLNIKAVISVVEYIDCNLSKDVKNIRIQASDTPEFVLRTHFDYCVDFIKQQIQNTNVLVHCAAGISRSVTIIIAYLIKEKSMTPDNALIFVKQRRPFAQPNQGFYKQLIEYHQDHTKQQQK